METWALERAVRETRSEYDREHVTSYVYRHPHQFAVARVPAPPAYCLPHARVTLDTAEDYRVLYTIFDRLYDGAPIPVHRLVQWLRSDAASAALGEGAPVLEKNREEHEYPSGA